MFTIHEKIFARATRQYFGRRLASDKSTLIERYADTPMIPATWRGDGEIGVTAFTPRELHRGVHETWSVGELASEAVAERDYDSRAIRAFRPDLIQKV